jgi:folate-binding protein YgfZ
MPLLTAFAALDHDAVACRLDELSLLAFEGADAATFLQGQLSSDVAALASGGWQRSSYNSPKGRVLANLVVWRAPEAAGADCRALVATDLAPGLAKRLRMFVLRAKVAVREDARVLLGIAGPRAAEATRAVLGVAPEPERVLAFDGGHALGFNDGRVLVDTSQERGDALLAAFDAHAVRGDAAVWRYARIRAGVPLITAATSDQFVPQALNWDVLGGVSFRKGCYPGQEIVARMQYLGRLKERLFAFRVAAQPPASGTRLYAASFADQACGTVTDAAPHPAGGSALLAVTQRSAAESDTLHLEAPDGPALEALPLPYAVPEPGAPRGRVG